jgi:hypothetical protein
MPPIIKSMAFANSEHVAAAFRHFDADGDCLLNLTEYSFRPNSECSFVALHRATRHTTSNRGAQWLRWKVYTYTSWP